MVEPGLHHGRGGRPDLSPTPPGKPAGPRGLALVRPVRLVIGGGSFIALSPPTVFGLRGPRSSRAMPSRGSWLVYVGLAIGGGALYACSSWRTGPFASCSTRAGSWSCWWMDVMLISLVALDRPAGLPLHPSCGGGVSLPACARCHRPCLGGAARAVRKRRRLFDLVSRRGAGANGPPNSAPDSRTCPDREFSIRLGSSQFPPRSTPPFIRDAARRWMETCPPIDLHPGAPHAAGCGGGGACSRRKMRAARPSIMGDHPAIAGTSASPTRRAPRGTRAHTPATSTDNIGLHLMGALASAPRRTARTCLVRQALSRPSARSSRTTEGDTRVAWTDLLADLRAELAEHLEAAGHRARLAGCRGWRRPLVGRPQARGDLCARCCAKPSNTPYATSGAPPDRGRHRPPKDGPDHLVIFGSRIDGTGPVGCPGREDADIGAEVLVNLRLRTEAMGGQLVVSARLSARRGSVLVGPRRPVGPRRRSGTRLRHWSKDRRTPCGRPDMRRVLIVEDLARGHGPGWRSWSAAPFPAATIENRGHLCRQGTAD